MIPGLRKAVRNLAQALAALALWFDAGSAWAGADPFPLALSAAESTAGRQQVGTGEPFYVSALLNGEAQPRLVRMRETDGELSIAREGAVRLALAPPPCKDEFVRLNAIADIRWKFDPRTQQLAIEAARVATPANMIDFRKPHTITNARVTNVAALMIDYDMTAGVTPRGQYAAGLVGARIARGDIALSSWGRGSLGAADTSSARLDSALTVHFPASLRTLSVGDFISVSAPNARSVRLGGVQLASNFALRPDLITYPLPDFAGQLAVPGQVDLLVNDRRLATTELQAGQFSLRNIPVGFGRSQLGVVVRDPLGRESYASITTYVSQDLLAPGLVQWAAGAGTIRARYGQASFDYGAVAASGMIRLGINRSLTLGVSTEGRSGLVGFGGEGVTLIGSIAQLSLQARVSRRDDGIARRTGSALGFALQASGPSYSVRLAGRRVSSGYDDLASLGGDPPPPSFLAALLNFDLRHFASISIQAATEREARPLFGATGLETRRVASAALRRSFGQLNLYAEGSWRRASGHGGMTMLIGMSMGLGTRTNATASYSRLDGAGSQADVGLTHTAVEPGDVGYGLHAQRGAARLLRGGMSYVGSWGDVSTEAEAVNGEAASRLNLRGTLVATSGGLFATRQSDGGMVLVDTGGLPGIVVERENRAAAISGRRGKLLISGLVQRTPQRVGIDPVSLPLDAVAASRSEVIAVPGGSVARLDLGIHRYRPRRYLLLDPDGRTFALGTQVRAIPSQTAYLVGTDGTVEVNADLGDRALVALPGGPEPCRADLPPRVSNTRLPLACIWVSRPVQVATRSK